MVFLAIVTGGLFGKHNTDKTNEMNYKIMQEQNRFNAEEAKKNRDWQELMYRMFGTSSAKANDMRAAGLNPLLGDVSASGNVGSGSAATAATTNNIGPSATPPAAAAPPAAAPPAPAAPIVTGKQIGRAHV